MLQSGEFFINKIGEIEIKSTAALQKISKEAQKSADDLLQIKDSSEEEMKHLTKYTNIINADSAETLGAISTLAMLISHPNQDQTIKVYKPEYFEEIHYRLTKAAGILAKINTCTLFVIGRGRYQYTRNMLTRIPLENRGYTKREMDRELEKKEYLDHFKQPEPDWSDPRYKDLPEPFKRRPSPAMRAFIDHEIEQYQPLKNSDTAVIYVPFNPPMGGVIKKDDGLDNKHIVKAREEDRTDLESEESIKEYEELMTYDCYKNGPHTSLSKISILSKKALSYFNDAVEKIYKYYDQLPSYEEDLSEEK